MRLQVLSDIHLTGGAPPVPATRADLIVLAGDIARPPEAIAWAATLGKPVLYVPGNHEFYGSSIESTLRELASRAAPADVNGAARRTSVRHRAIDRCLRPRAPRGRS